MEFLNLIMYPAGIKTLRFWEWLVTYLETVLFLPTEFKIGMAHAKQHNTHSLIMKHVIEFTLEAQSTSAPFSINKAATS